jgi:hypothetical protein
MTTNESADETMPSLNFTRLYRLAFVDSTGGSIVVACELAKDIRLKKFSMKFYANRLGKSMNSTNSQLFAVY